MYLNEYNTIEQRADGAAFPSRNLPTGNVVDKLLGEWSQQGRVVEATTDANGFLEMSLFHGDYEATIQHPNMNHSLVQRFDVMPSETSLQFKAIAQDSI
ncbi:hypothetical protein RJ641_013527 [Dillenia turbinata]|uniref:Uncharacterized protein n=1 Tax=Dillenia turbinata TaxID=194707 RepID=A0AAN8W474_9MAGN